MPGIDTYHTAFRPLAIDRLRPCGHRDGASVEAAALARTAAHDLRSDVAIKDREALFSAVKARLGLSVGEGPDATTAELLQGEAGRVRASVLESMTALDRLHATLARELGRRQQLELEVFDARTALAQARAELAGTQAGERHARHLALHDSLTSLPNRRYFGERLDVALTQAHARRDTLAVLYIDLDGFKAINDTHGHGAGDELLRVVAARLVRAVRGNDMVSRIGGDEFACLLVDVPARHQIGRLACKLIDAVSAPFMLHTLKLTVRPSIGIAVSPSDGTTAQALLKSADGAMYRAKQEGSGYAFCAGPAER